MNIDILIQIIKTNDYQRQVVRKLFEQSSDYRKIPMLVKKHFYELYENLRVNTKKAIYALENLTDSQSEIYNIWNDSITEFDNFTYDIIVCIYKIKLGDTLQI